MISRSKLRVKNRAMELDTQVYDSKLRGICLSGFRGPDISIASIKLTLRNLKTLDMSYSRMELVSEVSRALEEVTKIKAINIATSPHMRMCYPESAEPLGYVIARLIRKCPKLAYIILHGLDMFNGNISHICKSLLGTMRGIDIHKIQNSQTTIYDNP